MDNYQFAYSQPVINFVTTSVKYCILLEHTTEQEKDELTKQLLVLLPQIYIDVRMIDEPDHITSDYLQRFVTEDDYNDVVDNIKSVYGADDAYLEVFVEDMRYSDEPITAFLSENLTDIYQELKDMALNYQTRDEELMSIAVVNAIESYREHWGQKLLNALRQLHALSLHEEE